MLSKTLTWVNKFLKQKKAIIIIFNLLMSPLLGTCLPYGLHIRKTGQNPPRTANTAGTYGLTCLPKDGEARDNTFLVTHPMTDQRCLTSAITRRNALTSGPSTSKQKSIKYLLLCRQKFLGHVTAIIRHQLESADGPLPQTSLRTIVDSCEPWHIFWQYIY
jgi:hypothetical protein